MEQTVACLGLGRMTLIPQGHLVLWSSKPQCKPKALQSV